MYDLYLDEEVRTITGIYLGEKDGGHRCPRQNISPGAGGVGQHFEDNGGEDGGHQPDA